MYAIEKAVKDGRVTERKHPTKDLWIYNYTPKTQYDRDWDDVTLMCRGLVLDGEGKIMARPFKKFFNYGEIGPDGQVSGKGRTGDEEVRVLNKEDGQLFIGFIDNSGELVVSTRGSFESEQAQWAREWLKGRVDVSTLRKGMTYLGEIIYKEGRIVLDYGDFEGIIGLGTVEEDGSFNPDDEVGVESGLFAKMRGDFGRMRLDEALNMEDRAGAEGIVLLFDDGEMLKIKQKDYVQMHRVVTGLNESKVLEAVADGPERVAELRSAIPEELHEWFDFTVAEFVEEYEKRRGEVDKAYEVVAKQVGEEADKKKFAEALMGDGDRSGWLISCVFMLKDGKEENLRRYLWKLVRG